MSHTATPWRLRTWPDGAPNLIEGALINSRSDNWCGRWICTFEKLFVPEQTLADAEHIVKCVNNHDKLVQLVGELLDELDQQPTDSAAIEADRQLLARLA